MKPAFMIENIFWRRISLALVLLAMICLAGKGVKTAWAEGAAVPMNEFGPVAVKQMNPEESQPETEAVPEEEILAEEEQERADLPVLKSVAEFLEDRDRPGQVPEMISYGVPEPAGSREQREMEEKNAGKDLTKEMEKLLKRLDEKSLEEEKDYGMEFSINSEAQETELAWDQTELADGVTLSFTPDEQHDLLFDLYAVAQEAGKEETPENQAGEVVPKDLPTPAEWQGAAGEIHFDEMVLSPVMAMGTSLVKMVSLVLFEQMNPEPIPAPEPSQPEPSPMEKTVIIPETLDVSDLVTSRPEPEPVPEPRKDESVIQELNAAVEEARKELVETVKEGAEALPVSEPEVIRAKEAVQPAGFITSMTLAPQPMMEKMAQNSVATRAERAMEKAFSSYKPVYTQFVEKIITPTVILSASYVAPPRLPTYTGSYPAYEPLRREPTFLNEKFTFSVYTPSSFRYLFGSAYSGSSAYDSRDRKKKRRYFGVE